MPHDDENSSGTSATREDIMRLALQSKVFRIALASTTALAMAMTVQPSLAQQQDGEAAGEVEAEAIIVTGSRIVRRDYEANSPIVTAGEELLKNSATAAIETNLNKLPAFTPAQTPTLGGDIQPTATNTPGAATVSLRSLGTNRNLVLIDGRRATPANALGVVDINTIPAAAVERVEIITGGASATYGADAVGGVVNFILKKNFQGLSVDGNIGVTSRGDGREYSLSAVMGTNFDDGRGNITIGIATNDRRQAKAIDRSWFTDVWRNPVFTGNEFFPDFSGFQAYGGIEVSQTALDGIFGAGKLIAGGPTGYNRLYFNNDGTAFTGFFQSPDADGVSRFKGDITGTKWKKLADGTLAQTFQDTLVLLPLNRFNAYSRGKYEINDWIGAFMQATFTRVRTHTNQQPSPSVNGWSAIVPASNPVPTELRTLLNSRVIPVGASPSLLNTLHCDPAAVPGAPGSGASCDWQLTYYLNFANREARTDVTTYNLTAGLEGSIPGTGWTWEIYGSQGESETSALITGAASLQRFRQVVAAPNWGKGLIIQGNPLFGGFGSSRANCTSGFDPFNKATPPSQDCIEAISANLSNRAIMQQTVYEANAQGKILTLPAGDLQAAIGASHRQNRYDFINDTLTTQGRSFIDQAIGIYPSGNSNGLIRVNEFYGELLVPLLADMPFVRKLELELGARTSDYNTTGSSFTWKALADWQVTDWFRFRGGFNRAVRAPNIAELYLAPQQTFAAAGGGDVCRRNNSLGWSANPATNSNAANVEAVCRLLMNQSGIPTTGDTFYGNPQFFNAVGPAFAFPTTVGNPNLTPEKANTWTLGAVVNSPLTDEMFTRMRLSVDYYNIQIDNAIGPLTLDTAQRFCFDPTFNPAVTTSPATAAASIFCQSIGRVAGDGALGNVLTSYQNNGRVRTQGIDVQFDWSLPLGPGTFSLNSVLNYLITLKSAPLPAAAGAAGALVEYAGTLGPASAGAGVGENGLTPGAFRWKMLNSFSYAYGPATVALQWQHLPSAKSIAFPANKNTTFVGSSAYDLFNLSGTFAINDAATLRWGVDNLFDKGPPLSEYNPTSTGLQNSIGGNPINGTFFDPIGRRFYIGASFKL
jgi:iron complex outermembrane recepter protein